ncbi:MAG: helix-turn-helix transcriptional regulator [Myxococcales bacterium]|nr:helix-turn-helix transcriptional regulator [Myxococcales bacterium]
MPLARRIGARIRALREEAGLTIERLAYEASPSEDAEDNRFRISKGHLSSLERGLVVPTIATLERLAVRLEVHLADLVIDPAASTREQVIDLTRKPCGGRATKARPRPGGYREARPPAPARARRKRGQVGSVRACAA